MGLWEHANPLRQTGRLFDSTMGFDKLDELEQAMSWTSEDRLDAKGTMESQLNRTGLSSEGSVLWWKGFREGQRRLIRVKRVGVAF